MMKIFNVIVSVVVISLQARYAQCSPVVPALDNGSQMPDTSFGDSVIGLNILEFYVESLLPSEKTSQYASILVDLYTVKDEVKTLSSITSSEDYGPINEMLDLVINQTCAWLMHGKAKESQLLNYCNMEQMISFGIQKNLLKTIEDTRKSIRRTSSETKFNICKWMNKYIHCDNDYLQPIDPGFKASLMNRYSHCMPQPCNQLY